MQDNRKFLSDLFSYLGVRDDLEITTEKKSRENVFPKNRLLYGLFIKPSKLTSITKRILSLLPNKLEMSISQKIKQGATYRPSLSSEDRAKLIEIYRPEILRLEKLINRDLSKWLSI